MLLIMLVAFAFGSFSWWCLGNRLGVFDPAVAGQLVAWGLGGVFGVCLAEDPRGWNLLSDTGALLALVFLAAGGDLLLVLGPLRADLG